MEWNTAQRGLILSEEGPDSICHSKDKALNWLVHSWTNLHLWSLSLKDQVRSSITWETMESSGCSTLQRRQLRRLGRLNKMPPGHLSLEVDKVCPIGTSWDRLRDTHAGEEFIFSLALEHLERAGGCCWREGVWVFFLHLLPHWPRHRKSETGWMNGYLISKCTNLPFKH